MLLEFDIEFGTRNIPEIKKQISDYINGEGNTIIAEKYSFESIINKRIKDNTIFSDFEINNFLSKILANYQ